MLILTRRSGEAIIATTADGTRITVRVVSINGGQIRIGLDAPKSVHIIREELLGTERRDDKITGK